MRECSRSSFCEYLIPMFLGLGHDFPFGCPVEKISPSSAANTSERSSFAKPRQAAGRIAAIVRAKFRFVFNSLGRRRHIERHVSKNSEQFLDGLEQFLSGQNVAELS